MKIERHLQCVSKMPQSMILGSLPVVLVFLFTISFLPRAWGQEAPSPQVMIPEKNFNFKEVEEGKTIVHSFTILNRGREPLKIIKVRPG